MLSSETITYPTGPSDKTYPVISGTVDNSLNRHRNKIERMLAGSGITINGNQPWDIQVYNPELYERVLMQGSLGLGEAYMDGWWDCACLDELFKYICLARLEDKVIIDPETLLQRMLGLLSNPEQGIRA